MPQKKRSCSKVFQVESIERRVLLSGWGTLDSYQLAPGVSTNITSMATDQAGNLYVSYNAGDSDGNRHNMIRERDAQSGTWSTVLTTNLFDINNMAVDSGGNLYAAVTLPDSFDPNYLSKAAQWGVIEVPAGQNTFKIVDTDRAPQGTSMVIAIDAAGDIFVSGQISPIEPGDNDWVVRERPAGAASFHTVDDTKYGLSGQEIPKGVMIMPGGQEIFVAGGGGLPAHWLVRRSTDGGRTWATVDDYQENAIGGPNTTVATGITADSAGNLYAVGEGQLTTNDWIVRKSTNGGATWTIDDDFTLSPGVAGGTIAWEIETDTSGNVYVVGTASDAKNTQHSIVRTNAGGTWSTVDDFQPAQHTFGVASAVDSSGTIYTGNNVTGGPSVIRVNKPVSPIRPSGKNLSAVASEAFDGVVGSFADSDSSATASGFTASINWGDGQVSGGTIDFNNSTQLFDVTGSHTYASGGSFNVTITVHAGDNSMATIASTVNVLNRGPQPQVAATGVAYEESNYSITFAATDSDGLPIAQWVVDWGDGAVQNLPGSATGATHTYADGPAAETVKAMATDSAGRSNTATAGVNVVDVPPTAVFGVVPPPTANDPTVVQFSSATDVSPADVAAGFHYSFDFNNDGVFEITSSTSPQAAVPSNYLVQPGTHVVSAEVIDKDGLFKSYSVTIDTTAGGASQSQGTALSAASAGQIMASSSLSSSSAIVGSDGGTFVRPGGWVEYSIDLGAKGVKSARLKLQSAATRAGLHITMRLDDPTGPVIARFSKAALSKRGQSVQVRKATGVHKLFLVVDSGQTELNWFSFVPVVQKHTRAH